MDTILNIAINSALFLQIDISELDFNTPLFGPVSKTKSEPKTPSSVSLNDYNNDSSHKFPPQKRKIKDEDNEDKEGNKSDDSDSGSGSGTGSNNSRYIVSEVLLLVFTKGYHEELLGSLGKAILLTRCFCAKVTVLNTTSYIMSRAMRYLINV